MKITNKQFRCPHMNFGANVAVGRLSETEGGPITSYTADITVKCADCDLPFSFHGLPLGVNLDGNTMSFDGTEARMAIYPGLGGAVHRLSDHKGVRGFSIKFTVEEEEPKRGRVAEKKGEGQP